VAPGEQARERAAIAAARQQPVDRSARIARTQLRRELGDGGLSPDHTDVTSDWLEQQERSMERLRGIRGGNRC
jgi:hypothetical protein